ncbi:phosphoglycerate mutase family protein [Ruegeria sp. HKCCSP351]|uniref:SixA phosphatase family protein n=1 Tax=Ruegeria sp. HKCCSP351 TaxID=2794832 RepID=UPI001AE831E3
MYLIRHCEKELSGADPALTPEGRQRAADWAEMLQHVGLSAVITSDALRTLETGRIIAETLGLPTNALPRGDTAGLVDVLEFDHDEDAVLIVAHAETIPQILEGLGVLEDVNIDQNEFANLFVVIEPSSDAPVYVHLLMP